MTLRMRTADDRAIGAGQPGPITTRLIDLYWARHNDPEWSEAVDYSV